MKRRNFLALPSLAVGYTLPAIASKGAWPLARTVNVLDYGAVANGKTLNTRTIQEAIDAIAHGGGGVVYVPPGAFLTGGLVLRSRVTLYLEAGATLLGSTSMKDYPTQGHGSAKDYGLSGPHLLFAHKASAVTICGRGTIDGQGTAFWEPVGKQRPTADELWRSVISSEWKEKPNGRPSPMVEFASCSNVRVEGITLQNSPAWTIRPVDCDSVVIHSIRIRNPKIGPNTDGIDITASRNVMVSDCDIVTADDAIVIKAINPYGSIGRCANITVTNCLLSTNCNGFKIGTETRGVLENIMFSNSVIYNDDVPLNERATSGIAVEMVDGSTVDGVLISNIRIKNARTPIFVRLGTRTEAPVNGDATVLRNIMIRGVDAVGAVLTSSITGVPGHPVQGITLEGVRIASIERGTEDWSDNMVPENEKKYPVARMFGRLPAYGLYIRHSERVRLRGLELIAENGDARPALICDDVADIALSDLNATAPTGKRAVLLMRNVQRAFIHGCLAPPASHCFLAVEGGKSHRIVLGANVLNDAGTPISKADDVPSEAILEK